jgi:hypothetical protein
VALDRFPSDQLNQMPLTRSRQSARSRTVMDRVRNALLIFVLLAGTGAHWGALQSVAWTRMLAENLRTTSFTEAVVRTFDGQHPCSLCKVIATAKKSEKKAEFPQPLTKFEFPLTTQSLLLTASTRSQLVSSPDEFVESLSQQPPTPPPRAICA